MVESHDKSILGRMTQLDSLRAIAVFMVFAHHWLPSSMRFGIPWGESGVDLFFVLSGFLITGILLKARRYMEEGGQGVLYTAGQFYARRCLRILPLYYGILVLYAIMAERAINWLTPWLWTFTLNIYRTAIDPEWGGPMSHYWSLAVEEQFYLVWPWVILMVPRRFLLSVLVTAFFIGPVTKGVMALDGWSYRAIRFFTLSCMDTLAFGAVLAYFVDVKGLQVVSRSRPMKWLFRVSFPALLIGFYMESMIFFMTAKTLLFGWLIVRAASGFKGTVGTVLSAPPLVFLGKISFGLYLIHKPVPYYLEKAGLPVETIPPLVEFFLYSLISIVLASLSWKFFEAPINGLKKRFPYRHKGAIGPKTAMAAENL